MESRDECGDLLDCAVLVLEPVFHFLVDVPFVFMELAQSVCLDLLDLVSLTLQLSVQLLDELCLLLQTLFLLDDDRLFDFV